MIQTNLGINVSPPMRILSVNSSRSSELNLSKLTAQKTRAEGKTITSKHKPLSRPSGLKSSIWIQTTFLPRHRSSTLNNPTTNVSVPCSGWTTGKRARTIQFGTSLVFNAETNGNKRQDRSSSIRDVIWMQCYSHSTC